MEFYYINHTGDRIDLSDYPYRFQSGDILDWTYAYDSSEGVRNRVSNFRKAIKEFSVQVAVLCDFTIPRDERESEWRAAVNHLMEVFEVDVLDEQEGRLYSDTGYYMNCMVIGSTKSDWKMGLPFMFNTLKVLAKHPVWIKEEKKSFIPVVEETQSDGFLDYEYDYMYDFSAPSVGSVIWQVDHYAPCEFLMTIFGEAADPRVVINGHPYQIYTTLLANEYLQIDSRNNKIIKYLANGTRQNIYDLRAKSESVFEPITPGNIAVSWPGSYGFDLTLYLERSEPRWSTKKQHKEQYISDENGKYMITE